VAVEELTVTKPMVADLAAEELVAADRGADGGGARSRQRHHAGVLELAHGRARGAAGSRARGGGGGAVAHRRGHEATELADGKGGRERKNKPALT
jgi:hypothetical protein